MMELSRVILDTLGSTWASILAAGQIAKGSIVYGGLKGKAVVWYSHVRSHQPLLYTSGEINTWGHLCACRG